MDQRDPTLKEIFLVLTLDPREYDPTDYFRGLVGFPPEGVVNKGVRFTDLKGCVIITKPGVVHFHHIDPTLVDWAQFRNWAQSVWDLHQKTHPEVTVLGAAVVCVHSLLLPLPCELKDWLHLSPNLPGDWHLSRFSLEVEIPQPDPGTVLTLREVFDPTYQPEAPPVLLWVEADRDNITADLWKSADGLYDLVASSFQACLTDRGRGLLLGQ